MQLRHLMSRLFDRARYLISRLGMASRRRRVFVERIGEPLHLNFLALFVALFGSIKSKIDFDLVVRQQFAFPLLHAAELARQMGVQQLVAMEIGVASGAGLLNICGITERITKETGVRFRIIGFDTGKGMPPPIDYRDLPELWQEGDFPMDERALRMKLPQNAELAIGPLKETIPAVLESITADERVGFVSIDVDYYSSTVEALKIFSGAPNLYLPRVLLYLDDIIVEPISPWTGELLAINEFNAGQKLRKIAPFPFLRSRRIFQRARWIDQIYFCHVHDHEWRSPGSALSRAPQAIKNELL
jgi:hypothetical protein